MPQTERLDPRLSRILRAAAVIGATFDAVALARLLDLNERLVLESLQELRDLGAPIEDDGDGHLRMPDDCRAWLLSTTLPSLQKEWRRELDDLHGHHATLEQRLYAVATLAHIGEPGRAAAQLVGVCVEIAALPRGPFSSAMRTRAKLERARIEWLGGDWESPLPLPRVFEVALEAWAELDRAAPAQLRADAASMVAGIACDLGDGAALEQAESVLSATVAALTGESRETMAAGLLNGFAGLALRMGELERAIDLLTRSYAISTAHLAHSPADSMSLRELADSQHLLAQMLLEWPPAPLASEAVACALDHAVAAEAAYRELGLRRDVGRVVETRGRLEAWRGNDVAAEQAFAMAFDIADETSDLTGLGRTTAAVAELVGSTPAEALDMLARSTNAAPGRVPDLRRLSTPTETAGSCFWAPDETRS